MTKKSISARPLSWVVGGAVLIFALIAVSCLRDDDCPDGPQTEQEMYFGFDDRNDFPGSAECFGPSADCGEICSRLQPPNAAGGVAWAEVCERVPAPDGWADAGFRGWEDAGYRTYASSSQDVDPARILHVVFKIVPFCGT
jgi:hypothetical protein